MASDKSEEKPHERIRVFKKTASEWHPAYKLNDWCDGVQDQALVEVSFIELRDGTWRVCAWGADDHGLEKDFTPDKRSEAFTLFLEVIGLEHVDGDVLRNKGFVQA